MTQYIVIDTGKGAYPGILNAYGPFPTRYAADTFAGKTGYSGDQGLSSVHLKVFPLIVPWEQTQEALEAKLDGEVFL